MFRIVASSIPGLSRSLDPPSVFAQHPEIGLILNGFSEGRARSRMVGVHGIRIGREVVGTRAFGRLRRLHLPRVGAPHGNALPQHFRWGLQTRTVARRCACVGVDRRVLRRSVGLGSRKATACPILLWAVADLPWTGAILRSMQLSTDSAGENGTTCRHLRWSGMRVHKLSFCACGRTRANTGKPL